MNSNEWFASWFDTSYYHLLYKDRDLDEAKRFIVELVDELEIPKKSKVLDLACGKGRHAYTLFEKGMNVLGVDLSEESILEAKKLEQDGLHFKVQDMRYAIDNEKFEYIFNLFTSFGYFEEDQENEMILMVINGMLTYQGTFVFDFLNLYHTLKNLVEKEEKTIEGVHFKIERFFDGKFVRKSIEIDDEGKLYHFEEKVRAYSFSDLKNLLQKTDFEIIKTYGNFTLEDFIEEESDRAIFICKRKD